MYLFFPKPLSLCSVSNNSWSEVAGLWECDSPAPTLETSLLSLLGISVGLGQDSVLTQRLGFSKGWQQNVEIFTVWFDPKELLWHWACVCVYSYHSIYFKHKQHTLFPQSWNLIPCVCVNVIIAGAQTRDWPVSGIVKYHLTLTLLPAGLWLPALIEITAVCLWSCMFVCLFFFFFKKTWNTL